MAVKDFLMVLEQIGFTEVVLPFILVFTVIFAVLQKSKVLGVDSKGNPKSNYNAMVAFVIGFFVLIMFRTLKVITVFTRYVAVLLVAFVFLGIILSIIGGKVFMSAAVKFIALALLLFVLLESLVVAGVIPQDTAYRVILPLLVAFLVAAAIIAVLTSKKEEPKAGKEEKPKKAGRQLNAGQIEPGEEAEL
ncbi:MAG: hypothetical protein QXM31_04065 [Candidatus Woesearchaeota archaeon]